MIGRRYEGEIQQQQHLYHLSKQQLETFLHSLACINLKYGSVVLSTLG